MNTAAKIIDGATGRQWVQEWQAEGHEIVFTNGCFDILHLGHVDYLEKARNLGGRLVLGLNTDASISRLKGPERPMVAENARARVMAALAFVDAVILFAEDTPLELIQTIRPDILVKGDDYAVDNIVGADFVLEHGGRVETIPLVPGFSTSNLIQKIRQQP